MSTPTVTTLSVALIASITAATAGIAAAETATTPTAEAPRSWNIGAKAGLLLPGSVYVDAYSFEGDVDTDAGAAVTVNVDAMVAPRLSVGLFGFFATSEDELGADLAIATLGGTIKARFAASERVEVRPGLALGYQRIERDPASTTGFDIGAFVEIAVPRAGSRTEWLFEGGFITQPTGGDEYIDLSFGPILYITAGIGYGA
jgi:hypothetical protein